MVNNFNKVVMCVVCFVSVWGYGANYKKKAFERILTNIYKGKIKDVEDTVTKILQSTKKDEYKHTAMFLRAYLSYTRYLYKDAEKICDDILSSDNYFRECLWLKFMINVNRGDIDKAKEFVESKFTWKESPKNVNLEELSLLNQLFTATLYYESYDFDRFKKEGKKIYKKFIADKGYKKLNIFELEELATILFNLYERTGKLKYLNYVLYFGVDEEQDGLSESGARDLIEYMLEKNKSNINAYITCAWIGYEYRQMKILGECLKKARKINPKSPIIQFFRILINFRRLILQNPYALITFLEDLATQSPEFYYAHLLLSFAYSTLGNLTKAEENVWKALKLHKDDITALSVLYVILKSKGSDQRAREILDTIMKNKFKYASFLFEAGVQVESVARFVHAHQYFKRAYRLDRSNMKILKKYSTNLSRMKGEKKAYRLLTKYIKMNPFDIDAMNVYNLLTKIKDNFITIKTKNFVIKLNTKIEQSEVVPVYDNVLMPFYLGEIAEKTLEVLTKRYGINLPLPIHLELLTDSEDLAVRTFGFPLLGVLGSCFGPFLTTLSPKARFDMPGRGSFNWAAVFWHELSHSFHLYLSDFKVQRWFTEGLATYEEGLADSRWSEANVLTIYLMYKQKQLPSLEDLILNRAQVQNQRLIFYDYGAIIQEYLDKTYGFGKIIELLKLWKKNFSAKDVFERGLGKTTKEISDEFDKFLDEKFKNLKIHVPMIDREKLQPLLQNLENLPKMDLNKEQLEQLANYSVFVLSSNKKIAQRIAKIVINKDSEQPTANFVMGVIYKELEINNKKAKEHFMKAIEKGYDYSNVYKNLGTLHYEDSNYVDAVDYLNKAIERNPYYIGVYEVEDNPYLLLGKIYEETKQFDKAYEIYNKYLNIDGKNYDVIFKIANNFFEKGDYLRALDYYKLAAYIKLDNPLLHFNVVKCYLKLKEYDKAFSVLTVLEKFAQVSMASAKNKEEKKSKKEMLARIYCTKAKVAKAQDDILAAEKFAKTADKILPVLKCLESVK